MGSFGRQDPSSERNSTGEGGFVPDKRLAYEQGEEDRNRYLSEDIHLPQLDGDDVM